MKKRRTPPAPLLWVFLTIATGIAVSFFLALPSITNFIAISCAITVFLCLIAVFFVIVGSKKYSIIAFIAILVAATAFGAFRFAVWSKTPPNAVQKLNGMETTVFGDIAGDVETEDNRQRFVLRADSAFVRDTVVAVSGRVRIYLYDANPVAYGDRIAISAKLQEPWCAKNPYAYDFKKSLETMGIESIAFVYRNSNIDIIDTTGGAFFLKNIVNPLRDYIAQTIDSGMHGDAAALLKGLMLGLGRNLPDDVRDAFADSGTVHILAVSGLHVGLIAGMAWILLVSVFRVPRFIGAIATISLLIVFAGLVGGRPSVLRAAFMFSIIVIGAAMDRPANLLNSIGAAGAILLAIKPIWITDIGFQLSFSATLGIAYLLPKFQAWLPERLSRADFLGKWIVSPFLVSLSATIGTTPFVALHFHRFQLIGPIANLLVIPPLGIIIGYGLLATLIEPIWSGLAVAFLASDWFLLKIYLLNAVKFFASVPCAYLTFPHPSHAWVGIYFVMTIGLPSALGWLKVKIVPAVLYLAAVALIVVAGRETSVATVSESIRVSFFDVGQGDCALIEFEDGREILIDGGPPGNTAFSVEPYLQARGLRKIDAVLMTHSDADHVGGLRDLQDNFEFGIIYVPYATYTSSLHRAFIETAESTGTPVEIISAGESLENFSEITILWPDSFDVSPAGSLLSDPNEASIVLMLRQNDAEILFTGDIGAVTERKIIAAGGDLDCDVVKVPHHGSKYSSCAEFIASTTPLAAVISVGEKNRFGHPSPDIVEGYEFAGCDIFRTDENGAVIMFIEDSEIRFDCFLGGSRKYSATDQPTPKIP